MKQILTVLTVVLFAGAVALAEDKKADKSAGKEEVKTVTGTSGCAKCEGLPVKEHDILLVDADKVRWVLKGNSASYKAAHKVRQDSKKMTATLAGKPETKKDEDGKEYKEVKVSEIKIVEEKA